MLLYNIERLRSANWTNLYQEAAMTLLRSNEFLPAAEQVNFPSYHYLDLIWCEAHFRGD